MNDNEKQKKTNQIRKTLSLKVNTISKNDTSNGRVLVEIKRKKDGLNRKGAGTRRSGKYGFISEDNISKLTDAEFKARVKALQNAIKADPANQPGPKIATLETKSPNKDNSANFVKDKKDTVLKKAIDNNQCPKKSDTEEYVSGKNSDNKNIIKELIKLAPKNKISASQNKKFQNKDPLKAVVFRSDAFAKKAHSAKTSVPTKNERSLIHKSCEPTRLKNSLKETERQKNSLKRSNNLHIKTETPNTSGNPQRQKKYVQSATPKSTNPKKQQRIFNNKNGKDGGSENLKLKTVPTRFNKRDLDRAINETDVFTQRSIASINRTRQKAKRKLTVDNKKIAREVIIPDSISVGELANRMAVRASEIVKFLMSVGTMATVNQTIDGETAEVVCSSFGHVAKRKSENDFEQELDYSVFDTNESLATRDPIVTVMGHVDHGKTTLLDTLRKTSVAEKEAGGITQHVAAYQVEAQKGKYVTFIDTPGHAAFSKIRERGANITDIIVLVVAADDGIKEQTIEVISEAKKNNVPLIVAINKIDKPDVNIEKIKSELMQYDVLLECFGGDVLSAEISARDSINIDKLLEVILLQAEILDLKANPNRKATCTVLESRIEKGRGIVASVIVNSGTLNLGDVFVVGSTYGKVRTLTDCLGRCHKVCKPSVPIEITGFDQSPEPGDVLVVVDDVKKAHEISERRKELVSRKSTTKNPRKEVDKALLVSDNVQKVLNIYIKADVYSSLDAVEGALLAINCQEVKVSIVGKNIGVVNESDVDFAKTSNAIIVCFNVGVSTLAKSVIKNLGIKVISSNIIYRLIENIVNEMETLLPPIIEERYIGKALVKKLFTISKVGTIAGCVVTEGIIKKNNSRIKCVRDGKTVYEGEIKSMKHEKDEIKECGLSHECGILSNGFNNYAAGDVIDCYDLVAIQRHIKSS